MSHTLTDHESTAFYRVFSEATQDASRSMQTWTSGEIELELSELHELPLEEVASELDMGDELLTIVALSLTGNWGGQILLAFDEENGRRLAASLLQREVETSPEWSPIEISALNETGNIVACAYVHRLSELINDKLVPSPPMFMQDFGASVLQQAVMSQAVEANQVLVCKTLFHRKDDQLNWNLLVIPDSSLLQEIKQSAKALQ